MVALCKMWMPTDIRRKIFQALFNDGVLVVADDVAGIHDELGCLNIYALQIGRSFTNKGFTNKRYAWSHAYFTLTDEGIAYLRAFFGLPEEAKPHTLEARKAEILDRFAGRPARGGRGGARGGFRGDRPPRGEFNGERRERRERREVPQAQ